ncbi:hypothetical protein ECTW14301_3585, partial [Escherichia coli TW14301]
MLNSFLKHFLCFTFGTFKKHPLS